MADSLLPETAPRGQPAPLRRLSHAWPKCTDAGHDRLNIALMAACYYGCETASLVKRLAGAAWTIRLQCDHCCGCIGSALRRADFPEWESFPEWDAEAHQTFSDQQSALVKSAWEERQRKQREEYALAEARLEEQRQRAREDRRQYWMVRRREYAAWCRTAPEWATMRQSVIRRADGICEACLSTPAVTAHHLTYDLGVLPPAWLLRAVCRRCHDRLHADKNGDSDEWCPGSIAVTE